MILSSSSVYLLPLILPAELTPIHEGHSFYVGLILFISFLIIAFARLSKASIFSTLAKGLTKGQSINAYLKETVKLKDRSSILLIFNYILSAGLVVYLLIENLELSIKTKILLCIGIPFFLFFRTVLSLILTEWITGEKNIISESIAIKIVGIELSGIIYFICGLVWVLNYDYADIISIVIIWTVVIESVLHLFKSMIIVYKKGIAWFYLILYLCTLEILPLFVVFYSIKVDLSI